MDLKIPTGNLLALLISITVAQAFSLLLASAGPVEIIVPDTYQTIQEAIDAANPGDIIRLRNGIYYENIVVNKSLSILGENRDATIIDGRLYGNVIKLTADYVSLKDLTIRNSGQSYSESAVFLNSSNSGTISNVNIMNSLHGIRLLESKHNNVSFNNIEDTDFGISLESMFGTSTAGSSNNVLNHNVVRNSLIGFVLAVCRNNTLNDNYIQDNQQGIVLGHASNCTIAGNIVCRNGESGIKLFGSSGNTLEDNIVANNSLEQFSAGIVLMDGSSSNTLRSNRIENNSIGAFIYKASSNILYHNDFINNAKQVWNLVYPEEPPPLNVWDDDYPSGGNFWSDYSGADDKTGPKQDQPGSDGIGDTAYAIDGNSRDRYPLMNTWSQLSDSTPPTTTHDYDDLWHTIDFTITLTATDDASGVAQSYYRINDGPTKAVSIDGQSLIATESSNNTLEYWSIDKTGNEENHHILAAIKLDKTAPYGSIIINTDSWCATSSVVTLDTSATDATSDVSEMHLSNDNKTWSEWEPYTTSKSWGLLSGDGTKTVYVQYRDKAGLVSPTYEDTITLGATKPALETIPMWAIAATIVILGTFATVIIFSKKRK